MAVVGILGKKVGTTQFFDTATGRTIPVTVIEAGPCSVLQIKTVETDGYNAVQLGFDDKKDKHTTKAMKGHFDKAKVTPKRFIRELRMADKPALQVGTVVSVAALEGVKKVDVRGVSKGKGWAGVMKRYHFSGQGAAHGNTLHHRHGGSMGRACSISKGVTKGHPMPGHMGDERVTSRGLALIKIMPEDNLLLVKGCVPGAPGGYVYIAQSQKDPGYKP